jgi:hypothetical protein
MPSSTWQCYIFFYAPASTGAALGEKSNIRIRIEAGAFVRFTRKQESLCESKVGFSLLINDTKRDL